MLRASVAALQPAFDERIPNAFNYLGIGTVFANGMDMMFHSFKITTIALALSTLAANGQTQPVALPAGSWIEVRLNQLVSSDRNQVGDTFSATLSQPLIANGMVVARRGQTVMGRVSEVTKGGRIKGRSSIGIEIVELSLVDGQQVPVRTQLIETTAGSSRGRDAGAIGMTTGAGAAIGAAAAGGAGAGLGALAGAGAAAIGVLATKGRVTEIYPEDKISFRSLEAISIDTQRAEHAFQPVRQEDYSPTQLQQRVPQQTVQMVPGFGFYDPFFWGPSWGFYGRPGFGFGGGRGFRRFR